jgi:hypothetical protein
MIINPLPAILAQEPTASSYSKLTDLPTGYYAEIEAAARDHSSIILRHGRALHLIEGDLIEVCMGALRIATSNSTCSSYVAWWITFEGKHC